MHLLVVDGNAVSRTWTLTNDAEERIRSETPGDWEAYFVRAQTSSDGDGPRGASDEVLRAIPDAEVYLGFGIPRPLFCAAKNLRWIHSAAAGVGNALYPEMVASDVVLTNSAGVHAIPIAEYIVAGILYLFRGFDLATAQQQNRTWDKGHFVGSESPLREVGGSCVLIVGAGGIGSEAARRLHALGARCVGVRRRVSQGAPAGFERVVASEQIDAELPRADVVVLTAPLTADTRGMLTAQRLDLLPRHAIVVNVARGALVDEEALVDRLARGRLRGAVLDVFQEEPLATDSPLWQLRSTLVTPHVSPVSPGRFWERELDLFLENWRRYRSGEPLRNVVDKQAGY
ncbi:MAG TPA: D-2-hydroxyacid dehydrogenase [Gemmatimonadales bacterium]|jgi:phosphoglycerate dehydrogenase-like enzyme|nr:D-2-hydroxyacid dehydrogenase [Gemmatimonadales bacterium]